MAFTILSGETNPQLGGDVKIDEKGIGEQMSRIRERLKRHILSAGMTWKTLAPQVSDPTPFKDSAIEAICILGGYPIRVFKGSERGELASSQDDSKFNDRLRHRQKFTLTPKMIVPFVDRLIQMKVLPVPKGYSVVWPDLESDTDGEKAKTALTIMQAWGAYVSQNVEAVMPPHYAATEVFHMDIEKVNEMIEQAQSAMDSEEGMTPGMQPEEETEPNPVKLREGESLVHPETGQTIAKQASVTPNPGTSNA